MTHFKQEQLDFLNWEFGVFFHFGIRTFYEGYRDWDGKEMSLDGFCPTELDCEEWVKTAKEAGAAYTILVCKHHDGFANWPSKYTDYSVANTPWKGGKGDVVQEFVNACRKYDMKVGLYYSPAQFGLETVQAKAYDDYFISQVSELLTNYGKIDYIWFDGCGSENHEYDKDRIVREIRRLQPGILIFTMWDPDTRWIGNESGIAPLYNRLTVSSMDFSIKQAVPDLLDEPQFLPAECDARMRLENWFYSDSDTDTVKSLDELMGMYYYSVGRGANLLLNIGPDRRGKLPEPDKKALLAFGKKVKEVLGSEIACKVTQAENKVTVDTPLQLVNHVILSEEIDPDCEIEEFEIKVYPFPYGIPITVYKGATVGHKAICSFPTIRTNKIEITFDKPKRVNAKILYIPKY